MPHAEDIVNRVRRCLARYDGRLPEEAAAVAEEYAGAVEDVNARLQRCVALLRQGYRGDGIYQAELPPPVAEEAAALDFPDRGRWAELCREHGLPAVGEVDADAVVELNEAYGQEEAIEPLLRAHRRLAIGHGPLSDRIRVLNNLARADPTNPLWREDLAAYEKARHAEIERDAQRAYERGDLDALHQLHEEVRRDTWLAPPPRALARWVEGRYVELRDRDARRRLEMLEDAIAEAHGSGELYQTAGLLDDWRETQQRLAADPPPTPEAVTAAAEWVRQQEAEAEAEEDFRRACVMLEGALDHHAAMDRLERLWATATRFERPIPGVLVNRYRARMAEHRLDARRRFHLILTGSVAALLLLGAGVGFLVHRGLDARHSEAWQQQIRGHVEAEQWDEAQYLLDRLYEDHHALWSRPTFQALVLEVEGELTSDQLRRERLEAAVARAGRPPLEEVDEEALEEARRLAATDAEKLRVEELTARIERARAEARQQRDASYSDKLDEFRDRFVRIRGNDADDEAVRDGLIALGVDVGEALDAEVSRPLLDASRSLLDAINREIETYDQRITEARRRERRLAEIPRHYGDAERLADALEAFVEEFPGDAYGEEFREAADLAREAADVDRVREAFAEMANVRVATAEEAEARLAEIDALLSGGLARSPFDEPLDRYRDYLRQAVATLDPANAPERPGGPLDRLLSHRLIDDLFMLTRTDGGRFYFPPDLAPEVPENPAEGFRLRYIGKPDQRFSADALDWTMVDGRRLVEDAAVRSPQSEFAREAYAMLDRDGAAWEHRYFALAAALAADGEIDPLLQVMLLTELLAVADRWSWQGPDLSTWLSEAEALVERGANWLDPDDAAAEADRAEAAELIARLPDLAAHADAVEAWAADLHRELQPPAPVGVVWMAEEATAEPEDQDKGEAAAGPRRVVGFTPDGRAGTLKVLAGNASADGVRFTEIAEVEDGQLRWRLPPEDLLLGAIVYLASP